MNARPTSLSTLVLLLTASTLSAWTPAVDQRIASKAIALAPPDLRLVVRKFNPQFQEALSRAEGDEGSDRHFYAPSSRHGKLRIQLEAEINNAIDVMKNRKPVSEFVERLAVISHLISDANNPFHTGDRDPRLDDACRSDFEAYVERKTATMPTVFYGLEMPLQLDDYLSAIFKRSAHLYPLLGEEYFRFGERHTSDDFDDRSTAFGVASVSYSHAVTDLVNIYYYIWKESGGDVRNAAALRQGNLILEEIPTDDSSSHPGAQ